MSVPSDVTPSPAVPGKSLAEREAMLERSGLGVRRGARERVLGTAKRTLRRLLGDAAAARVHGARFAYLVLRRKKFSQDPFLSLALELLRPGDVAVDVGANGGDWTHALCRAVADEGSVFAFEASPYYAFATDAALKFLRCANLEFFHFGLSDVPREASILERNSAGEELSGTGFIVVGEEAPGRTAQTRLRRLDDVALAYPKLREVRLLKCDVEGHELHVFRGAETVLHEARPYVVSEVGTAYLSTHTDTEVFEFWADHSYTPFGFVSPGVLRRSESATDIPREFERDRIMVPTERRSEFERLISARIE